MFVSLLAKYRLLFCLFRSDNINGNKASTRHIMNYEDNITQVIFKEDNEPKNKQVRFNSTENMCSKHILKLTYK